MKSKHIVLYSFLLVVLLHAGLLAAIVLAPQVSSPVEVIPPMIQGVIVSPRAIEKPPEASPIAPSPVQKLLPVLKPLPKSRLPLAKASPSEQAIKQKQEVVPEPSPPEPSSLEPKSSLQQPPVPVTPPYADAREINNPAPVYPSISKRLGEEGEVVLEILVKADGSVGEIRLKSSSGYTRLDDTAIRAVKQWHFVAAKRGDEAIDYWYELPMEFSLNKS